MIIKAPAITIDWGGGATDYADYVIAVELVSPQSAVDDRTFGAPHATDAITGAESIILACRWSDALADDLESNEGTEGDLTLTPDTGTGTYTATVKYMKPPAGTRMQIGESAEIDLVLAVVDSITWTPAV